MKIRSSRASGARFRQKVTNPRAVHTSVVKKSAAKGASIAGHAGWNAPLTLSRRRL
jgi:hypothetical protein